MKALQLSNLWKVYYHSAALPSGLFLGLVPKGSFSSNFQRRSGTHCQLPTLSDSSHHYIPKHTDSSLPKYSHRMLKWKTSTFRGCVQLNLSDATFVMQLQAHIGATLLSWLTQMVLTHYCLCQCIPICHHYLHKVTHAKICFLLLFLLFLSNSMLPAAQPTSSKAGQLTLQNTAIPKLSRSLLSIGSWSVRRELSWLADISASNCPAIRWKLPESICFILVVLQGRDKCSCMQCHFHITTW